MAVPRNAFDLAYGMHPALADHMMGASKVSRSRGGNSSINSFASEQKDFISQSLGGDGRFVPHGGQMAYKAQPYTNESLVMGGSVAGAKYNPT